MTDELKECPGVETNGEFGKCPLCNGELEEIRIGNAFTKSRKLTVKCKQCHLERTDAAIHHGFDWLEEVARKAWQTRPREDALTDENRELKERVGSMEVALSDALHTDLKLRTRLAEYEAFHPRAMKLIRKHKNFVVVAEDEPYFLKVYSLIRSHEKEINRWTTEDENRYQTITGSREG